MANFRSMIENSTPSAADVGGLVAPEILAVTQLPCGAYIADLCNKAVKRFVGAVDLDLCFWQEKVRVQARLLLSETLDLTDHHTADAHQAKFLLKLR